ncbi:monovalent cation:proton antiporter-2 (CPA2) family protein [Myxococcota bacterium]|nr:monovalent cation:proton antiporter-2 (CPA2) family protein [Myxococcota bacterium]
MGGLLPQAAVYLGAAVVAVPVAKRLGLGSVLGYLLAGVLVGPAALGLVGDEGQDVMHFAEFGVVMMLFLVGLELEPSRLWRMRGQVAGLGGLQVLLSALVVALPALALGLPWRQALAVGLILSMSSTAIALQTLAEKGLLKADAGQRSFAVLLFQDLAVIPILALLPLLATPGLSTAGGADAHGGGALDALPGWLHGLAVLGAVTGVVLAGRFLVRPMMGAVARSGLREMFTAAALLIVVGVTLLMSLVGLSPALGAFLAGVVLANSEYRHELESDIEPFKGLLLGLFFIAVGASIDFGLLRESPARVMGLVALVVLLKGLVLVGLGRGFRMSRDQGLVFAVALSQVGEFAFVLFSFAQQTGVLPASVSGLLVAVTAFSMATTPPLFLLLERLVLPRLPVAGPPTREHDVADDEPPVIIAGFGRFGQITGRLLRSSGVATTVLDVDSDQVDVVRRFGQKVYYGDASRLDLLRAAGAAKARVLVVAVDDHGKAMEIVHLARKHFPQLAILGRARGRTEAQDLVEVGVEGVYRETFDTSLRVGADALRLLGWNAHRATRATQLFRRHDEAAMVDLAGMRGDQDRMVASARERIANLERVLQADLAEREELQDHGWDQEHARKVHAADEGR